MTTPQYKIASLAESPELIQALSTMPGRNWPKFMLHDKVSDKYWTRLYDLFPECQLGITDPSTNQVVAIANCLPISWSGDPRTLPDEGWDWAVTCGVEGALAGQPRNTLCALQIVVDKQYQGSGLSTIALKGMRAVGTKLGLNALVAPVRPNKKPEFPLIPMETYVSWRNGDGLPYDPWLRVHVRLGAKIIRVCPLSMEVTGTIAEWRDWTGLSFPGSGSYVITGALQPVTIDCDSDRGVYIEPNVWLYHDLT